MTTMEATTTSWYYKDKEVTFEDIKEYQAFVYLITCKETGKKYIGKKFIYSIRKVKGKARRQRSVSDWEKYYGSNELLKEEVSTTGKDKFHREILHLCKTRGEANFREVEEQFLRKVLYTDDWYNDTISGKYYATNVRKYL